MPEAHETRDRAPLRRLLESDRVMAAYLIGDLDEPFFEKGRWFVSGGDGEATAVILVLPVFAQPAVLSFGEADGIARVVDCVAPRDGATDRCAADPRQVDGRFRDLARLLGDCYLKIPPAHEAVLARAFDFRERDVLRVMALEKRDFRSRVGTHVVRRLDAGFPVDPILDVYRSYPGHFFEPWQLRDGVYYGSFEGARLVAVAGTHVYSPAGRVACVGNVATASDARGKGHAAACTSAVVEELYARGCQTIALHVTAANRPAQQCYARVGFHEHGPILQLRAALKGLRATG